MHPSRRPTVPWRLWIDTGGTFTDCLAHGPDGRWRRAKVLSSSTLRGRIARRLDDRTLQLAGFGEAPPGLFVDCAAAPLSVTKVGASDDQEIQIVDHRAIASEPDLQLVKLSALAPARWVEGMAVSVRSPEEAPILAARWVTGTPARQALPPIALRLATTRGTNALLERRGARTALLVTRGFGDLLVIGDQRRPDLFALRIDRPAPLYEAVFEIDERLALKKDESGTVLGCEALRSLPEDTLQHLAGTLTEEGFEAVAVAFLHSDRFPDHERQGAAILSQTSLAVSPSAELAPMIGYQARTETAVVNAYLSPVIDSYLDRVEEALAPAGGSLRIMTSAGNLVRRRSFHPKDSLLSGPAGGVVGAAEAGRQAGFERVIAFDMGGTSSDVARWDGDFDIRFEHQVGGARLLAPALAIESVAAGGGSICRFDGVAMGVGPESAGAVPGPACYGAGGPLTLTDVHLLLGRLDPSHFGIPIDPSAALKAFERLEKEIRQALGQAPTPERLLSGLLAIADERMAEAIRHISVREGKDPADYTLVAYGGAGGLHACSLAEHLGITTVLIPPDAGLLSARGLGAAVVERIARRQLLTPLARCGAALPQLVAELERESLAAVADEMASDAGESSEGDGSRVSRRVAELRIVGQESALNVEISEAVAGDWERLLEQGFQTAYEERFGYRPSGELELVSLTVAAVAPADLRVGEDPDESPGADPSDQSGDHESATGAPRMLEGDWGAMAVLERRTLTPDNPLVGPLVVVDAHSTTVVEPGWAGRLQHAGSLLLERVEDTR